MEERAISDGPPTAAGAIVMAGGIFGAAALQRIPDFGAAATAPLAIALAVVWTVIAAMILRSLASGRLAAHTRSPVGSFAICTWVAGTMVLARMAMLSAPAALILAKALFFIGLGIWLWFLPLAFRNLRIIAARGESARPNGIVLLSTVGTEAIALIALRLFPGVPDIRWAAAGFMAFGAGFYLAGLVLILRRYAEDRAWHLADEWPNANCILHGALSITGLTAAASGLFAPQPLAAFWIGDLAVFAAVETVEAARSIERIRQLGWWRALLVYDTSQWARNFTFGMFYAFSAALPGGALLPPPLALLHGAIIGYGQYAVLFLILAELSLMAVSVAPRIRAALPRHGGLR
ncbi:MAG TPA: hypothetical protein VFA50_16490 [Stellaceae bacterium]|nr:hypothetical protein [Stellaceae bacterium]